jgi:SSS family solute:Na+ symporter
MLPIANWEVGPKKFTISGKEILLLTIISSVTSYIGISLLTCPERFNIDRMLHRGTYVRMDDDDGALTVETEHKRGWVQKLLGSNERYSKGDRVLAWAVFIWTVINFDVFAAATLSNLLFGVWSSQRWFL